jgi:hypothetical protein
MAAPCGKCGATKTEPIRPGLRHKLARQFGYELRKCARCRKLRFLSRGRKRTLNGQAAPESGVATEAASQGPAVFYDPDGFNGCPRCGDMRFHRSHRGWFERRLLRHPPMVRCSDCGYRFPAPQV